LIHITELGGEYFRFDEVRQELRGERTGIRYAIGTRVRIQVSRVDLDGRKIDFRLVQEGMERGMRTARDRASERTQAKPAAKSRGKTKEKAKARNQPEATRLSPIQALKSAVKKAAASKKGKSKKGRR
jgi:ribonuclease R